MAQITTQFFVENETIVLSKNGVWLSDGIEITHEQTCKLFSKILRHEKGEWFLKLNHESKKIEVEDTPFFVRRIDRKKDDSEPSKDTITLTLNDDTQEALDPTSLKYKPGRLICYLERGWEAKFLSAPYFELLSCLEEDESSYYLMLGNKRIDLSAKN